MIASPEVKLQNVVTCTIVALLMVQQLHLVSLADSIDESSESLESAEAQNHGSSHGETDAEQEVESLLDDHEDSRSILRALHLGDFFGLSKSSKEADSKGDLAANQASYGVEAIDEDAGNSDIDSDFHQTRVTTDNGSKTTSQVYVSKVEHSKEASNEPDRPRIIKGFGMGMGKGFMG